MYKKTNNTNSGMNRMLSYLPVVSSLAWIGIYISCNTGSSHKVQSSFYYYLKVNVYYNALYSNYIYSLDSDKTWDSMFDKLNKVPTTLGKEVFIDSSVSEVWKANELHRKLNGGTLFNMNKCRYQNCFLKRLPKKRRLNE